ncbi:MAG: hypothetical protein Q4P29_06690 [Tissierellia bacterium]|nr:hypothetical protein [Tissierellia bacterium]
MFQYIKPRLKKIFAISNLYGIALYASMQGQIIKGKLLDGAMGRITISFKHTIGMILLFLLINAVFSFFYAIFTARQVAGIYCDLRLDYFEKLFQKSLKKYYSLPKGQITAEYTSQL